MINKGKIYGLVVSQVNITVTDICTYTKLDRKLVEKKVNQLIKENKIEYQCYS